MGGNIVGILAASYRYLGKPVTELTWAEAALFVVLPNAPGAVNVHRDRPLLLKKRNGLLRKLHEEGLIDRTTLDTACREPLPDAVSSLPFEAPHLTRMVMNAGGGQKRIVTTLDLDVQRTVSDAANRHRVLLENQGISNLAVIVVETRTGKVRAYVGSHDYHDADNGGKVDGVQAYRSTGSLLKPLLIAKSLDRGPYTIRSKIRDVPTFYGTFAPQNASKKFHGLVELDDVLIQSLNVPSARLLNAYGVGDFYDFLVEGGLQGLFRGSNGYGLTLILGGAEASLFELTQLYLSLAHLGIFTPILTTETGQVNDPSSSKKRLFSEGAAWCVIQTLSRLARPGVEYYWEHFDDRVRVAWKTGTSYGQKDGWAIGVNRQWTIGVWAGNFTGEGNAALTGAKSAAPLLFALFNRLTQGGEPRWFEEPLHDLKEATTCRASGYPAGPNCPETIVVKTPRRAQVPGTCPFHRAYLVDAKTGKSTCSLCWNGLETTWVSRFVVPPAVKEILTKNGLPVDSVPLHTAHCPNFRDDNRIELVYPIDGIRILVPRDFDGRHEKIVFSAKHQRPSTHLFWYLNGSLIAETVNEHTHPVELEPGAYNLTVQDEEGFTRGIRFTAYKRDT
jgi:penicillin-binding protein 1C